METPQTMTKREQDISYFITFCVEQYKKWKNLSGAEVVQLFDQYGVLEYLCANYETLHTQSHQWIIDDINQYITNRQ